MKYDRAQEKIILTCQELVWYARRRAAVVYHDTAEERDITAVDPATRRQLVGAEGTERLFTEYDHNGMCFQIECEVDYIDDCRITLVRRIAGRAGSPSADALKQARGEFFCAAYILMQSMGRAVGGELLLVGEDEIMPYRLEINPTETELNRFFEKLIAAVSVHAAPEIDRVTRRAPAIAQARFPYGEVREGQRELMETVYTTIRRHGRMYACAPTGIGKTIATLYPALRAFGEGHCEKIFYLTPKNTTGIAAADALRRLAEHGIPVRGVILTAKEAICPRNMVCRRHETCGLSPVAAEREDDAARALLACENPAVTAADITEVALQYRVCPYELSLRYSQYCDVVICDYNYLFDPRVALKRYFVRGGNYTFLVDEAHNLVERTREIWTKTLTTRDMQKLAEAASGIPALREAAETFRRVMTDVVSTATESELREDAEGHVTGFWATEELPHEYYMGLCRLVYVFEDILSARPPQELADRLKPIYYALRDILDRLGDYDEHFMTFMRRDGDNMQIRSVCLDPEGVVNDRLACGGSAVLFSATLSPLEYYREILGGRRGDTVLEVPSPFDPANLSVAVMDKISTRFLEREDTVKSVVRAILTCVKAKPGNYMVFCPSYHYMMCLYEAVHTAVPKLDLLVQKKDMTREEREAFLAAFDADAKRALVGFCVTGGIYSEGVDLVGKRLIGAIIVGVGLPSPSDEREAIRAYFDEKTEEGRAFAYVYPGMNRVLQAAGRVIRTAEDRGVILLIDDRFASPEYRPLIPAHWQGLKYIGDHASLAKLLERFWHGNK